MLTASRFIAVFLVATYSFKGMHVPKAKSRSPSSVILTTWLISSMSVIFSNNIQVIAIDDEMYNDDNEYEDCECDNEDDNDYLAEILAEEEREAEELAKLEAQMKELDEMKEQQRIMKENQKRSSGGMGGSNMMGGGKNKDFQDLEEELLRKETEAQKMKQEELLKEQEEAEKIKADRIAAEREAAFQAEMEKIKDEQKKKALKRQKAKDAKIVRRILKHSSSSNHYAVLGFKCRWGDIKLGPIRFCKIKNGDIKKAYRNMARMVHPDKNRDGRAEQAFNALEKSAAILQDEKQRKDFDVKKKAQLKRNIEVYLGIIADTWKTFTEILRRMKSILGPFSTPIIVLVALII